jgi:CDP-alcohol phosphatidyltransferase
MAAHIAQASALETTYKVREAEGVLDLYFYRKIGFRLAKVFAQLGVSPGEVTLLGGVFGIVAGHLYFYRDLRTNIVGMVLHVCANTLDNADGQLARLANRQSREGRIIDSLVDHLIFTSIYVHLALRSLVEGASPLVCLLAVAAGLSHAVQAWASDYFRNAYLYFVNGRAQAQLDSATALRSEYRQHEWRSQPWKKFLLALDLNVTRQQEMLSPRLNELRNRTDHLFRVQVPQWFRARYRSFAQPMFKWWGLLMTNTRMIVLFVLLLAGRPIWYFWLELTVLNGLLICLLLRQKRMSQRLFQDLLTQQEA